MFQPQYDNLAFAWGEQGLLPGPDFKKMGGQLVENTIASRHVKPELARRPQLQMRYPEESDQDALAWYYPPSEPQATPFVEVMTGGDPNQQQSSFTHELAHYYQDQNRNRVSLPRYMQDAQNWQQRFLKWYPQDRSFPQGYSGLVYKNLAVSDRMPYGDTAFGPEEHYAYTAQDFAENPNRVPRELWPYFEQMFDMNQMRYYPLQTWEGTPVPPPTPPPTPYPWR